MAKKKTKEYTAIKNIKADIGEHLIVVKKGDTVKLTENEANILKEYIEE
jgi:hypothetical protein